MAEPTKIKIPPAIQKFLSPDAPKDAKLAAASGMVPMPPHIQMAALAYFLGDADEDVAEAARETFEDLPESLILQGLDQPAHPKSLEFLVKSRADKTKVMQKVALHEHTTNDILKALAERCDEATAQILADNQVRLLDCPDIATCLRENPKTLAATREKMVSFLKMNGIVLEGESTELSQTEIQTILSDSLIDDEFPEHLIRDIDYDHMSNEEIEEEKKSVYQMVQSMSIAQKIKLALKGNKEARMLLIKDSNKIVSTSVLKSPKISDTEIVTISNNRSVCDEVIRIISANGEWTKHYSVQTALANNPKTPFRTSMRFAKQMPLTDLKRLAKNKNIPGPLQKLAKQLVQQKQK